MKCPNCPVPVGADCPSLTRPHPRFCELTDPSHPDYSPAYVGYLRGDRAAPRAPRPRPDPPPESPPVPPAPSPTPHVVPLSETRELLRRMKACPNWSRPPECGCTGARCAAGRGRNGDVTYHDCFACLLGNLEA